MLETLGLFNMVDGMEAQMAPTLEMVLLAVEEAELVILE
jgi:hypothetical protein